MFSRRGWLTLFALPWLCILLISARISHAQVTYTTSWVANSYSTLPTYVGNGMRSMWVAPEGVIYTSTDWDESQGSINVYQNGQKTSTFAAHGETQGGAISGDATDIFAALQFNTTLGGSGYVGRYNRSTGTRDLTWSASSDTTERNADVITGIADTGTLVYVSDHPDNLVRCYTIAGVWQSDWSLTDPGAIAVDGSGNIWVAQKSEGTIQEFSASGTALNTISMGTSSRPSALYFDSVNNQLMIGDQGPNMNIQIYGNLSSTPSLVSTFGVQGGYLDTTTGSKGQTGSQRFTRVVGIGKDSSGILYVLNNPWGGTWDLGRNGKTDIHAYNSAGVLQYTLQALNFEGNASFDPGTDGVNLYSGQDVYTGSGGAGYLGNSVDTIDYPTDPRVDVTNNSRGFDFGIMTSVNGHRILASTGQNPDIFLFSYFPANQYASIPFGTLPGQTTPAGYTNYFNTLARVRNGFSMDTNGDIWVGLDKTNEITHYPLTGFDANGVPLYGAPTTVATPSTIAPLAGIEYIPSTDTMVLMTANGTDWTSLGGRVEVYHGWLAGNTTNPYPVITLKTAQNPKGRTAAGNYLFISYVHTVPDIDAYNLTTGTNDLTMTTANPNVVVGNDVDSMYGIRAYQKQNGQYLISKDNYNNNSIVIHTMSIGTPPPDYTISDTPGSQTVTAGNSTTYTTSINALNGFTDTVSLSVSGLPTGATASFSPATITGSGSSVLTVVTASTVAGGTYVLTITGADSTSGTLSHSATVTLIVPGAPDFGITATPSSQTVAQGSSTTYTASVSALNGFTGTATLSVSGLPTGATASFNPTSVTTSGNSTLTVSTASTTAAGSYPLTITGTSGSLSHSATVTLVVQGPDFGITATPSSQTVSQGSSTTYTTAISALNSFTGTVSLSVSGLPTGVTAIFSPTSVATSGSSTLTISTAATAATGTYPLTITGTSGSLSHSASVTLVVSAATASTLPTGWTDQDIGSVGLAGSASYSSGTFTVNGAGSSISGTADQFNYAYEAAGTSYTITARVVSMTDTNTGAQAGVMVRETLDTGATMANINVTPANGVTWVYRTATGGSASGSRTSGLVAPYWVRVVRSGSTFTGYFSADGTTWTQQGTVSITMASNAYIGLVVSSRNSSELCTATFDNVSITTP
jgi:regulation of enolase protein 1 (concanavalin A-like superfamily)